MPTPADRRSAAWGEVRVLPENVLAVRAVRRLAAALDRPGRVGDSFRPLVLHGPPGVGKSLLVGELVGRVTAGAAVRTAQVISANDLARPTEDETAGLDGLAEVDLLAVEDLQHLPERAADAVCRLLDGRAARRRPTVLTAHAGPARLDRLPRRLTSRLAAGLVVPLEPLTAASRRDVLVLLADRRSVRLAPDALDWLATRATGGGVRPLLGDLEAIKVLVRGHPAPLSRAEVEGMLSGAERLAPAADLERIVARVAAAFGVKPRDVLGQSRLRAVLLPRQVAMYLARAVARLPLARIGGHFGGRDHSTVLHAVRKVDEAMAADPALAGTVRQLAAELG